MAKTFLTQGSSNVTWFSRACSRQDQTHNLKPRSILAYHSSSKSLLIKWLVWSICIHFNKYCNSYL